VIEEKCRSGLWPLLKWYSNVNRRERKYKKRGVKGVQSGKVERILFCWWEYKGDRCGKMGQGKRTMVSYLMGVKA